MAIVFLAAGAVVLLGGVGGSIAAQMGVLPASLAPHFAVILNVGLAGGLGLGLLGIGLLFRKTGRFERLMGGNTMSARIRRSRVLKHEKTSQGDAEEAEVIDVQVPPSPEPKKDGTRMMRRATGRISDRR